jgi:hypothetical protein
MRTVTLVASGDLRTAANQMCWPAQEEAESAVTRAIEQEGFRVVRALEYDPAVGHGFVDSQRRGMEVFRTIDPDQPLVVVVAAWQYSHHLLHGLSTHRGPILTLANWSGQWPGLVGMLNLNGSLTKAGIPYSTLWSEDFTDRDFRDGLRTWLNLGRVEHDQSHVKPFHRDRSPHQARVAGEEVARRLRQDKAIMGVFDEGCMGMYNAIIPDSLLNATGVFKERLSQSALYYEATQVSEEEAREALSWLRDRGMSFKFGADEETELTENQVLWQLRTYVAAVRIADDFGCDAIGIQYQQGLKDLLPASDLAEGLLNNVDRPPVYCRSGSRELYAGAALPHFNEVDECAGLDALITNRLWTSLNCPPETTLHDLRWGRPLNGTYVWILEISGAAPPAHFSRGYADATSERQPPMYFRLGGGTIKGVSKPGEIVWSRIYVDDGSLKADVGRASVLSLPHEEVERDWQMTTPQWPIMHAVFHGVTRDQMMARHKSNHIQVAYAPDAEYADLAFAAKASAFAALGIDTYICGSGWDLPHESTDIDASGAAETGQG